ncbi:phenolic glucoside malonyltransferase 1-like [Salvia splendens]|uniref:phenolic glucoside malonyltransferase 1-like n=1 Tax=Salvia splendens TaxID=180675 RepID=UPI001C25851E|nr:phenolic glucoside malonyltransferase 1-like [Salvia splendens]
MLSTDTLSSFVPENQFTGVDTFSFEELGLSPVRETPDDVGTTTRGRGKGQGKAMGSSSRTVAEEEDDEETGKRTGLVRTPSPVIALQITLFAGQGICIGITNHHAVADGSSIVNFVKSWGRANRSGDDEAFHQAVGRHLPVLDRNLVEDHGKLDSIAWKFVRNRNPNLDFSPSLVEFPINRVRSTLLLTKNQVQNLKNHVYANTPNSRDVSSFTVISAYAWICALRSETSSEDDEEEIVYFSLAADCRGRLNPPLPESYFGNCLVFVRAGARRGSLKKKGGFLIAVESIREATQRILQSDRGVVESADWPLDFRKNSGQCVVSVAGSPRFDVYEADFGWGKPRKQEFVHLDRQRSISLCKSRDFEGAFEIGLSRNKAEMDIFERVFGDPNMALE